MYLWNENEGKLYFINAYWPVFGLTINKFNQEALKLEFCGHVYVMTDKFGSLLRAI